MQSAQRHSFVELRPVVRLLAGLDLYKLADDLPVAVGADVNRPQQWTEIGGRSVSESALAVGLGTAVRSLKIEWLPNLAARSRAVGRDVCDVGDVVKKFTAPSVPGGGGNPPQRSVIVGVGPSLDFDELLHATSCRRSGTRRPHCAVPRSQARICGPVEACPVVR
jgi:hypothetical protein